MSVNVNDADWQKIQELFAKERQWMTAQMQMHIREVNSMFADERKKIRERYKEYDGCYLGHYAQWFFLVLLYDWHLCGCRRNRDDDCTELWKMIIRKSSFVSLGAFNWLLQNISYIHQICLFENVVEWQNLYIE